MCLLTFCQKNIIMRLLRLTRLEQIETVQDYLKKGQSIYVEGKFKRGNSNIRRVRIIIPLKSRRKSYKSMNCNQLGTHDTDLRIRVMRLRYAILNPD